MKSAGMEGDNTWKGLDQLNQTILIFFEGREHARLSRNIGMPQVKESIARPYRMVFEG